MQSGLRCHTQGAINLYEFSALDIAALQYIYGVPSIANAGDTRYVYDETRSNFIWDGSGNDTIDASNSSEPVTIFLEPGFHGFKGINKDIQTNNFTWANSQSILEQK